MARREEDFKNFLSLYAQKRYKLATPPVIKSIHFSAYEAGDYGEEGYISSGTKTELNFQGPHPRDFWGIDNEDLAELLNKYFMEVGS